MGSGYIMNAYALDALKHLTDQEQKEALEALGVGFLTDNFSCDDIEDFQTRSKRGAELVHKAVTLDFKQRYGENYPFSVDLVEKEGKFKVAFHK